MINKIFGIGLAKTGTTSLIESLKILGYDTLHGPKTWDDLKKYQAFADMALLFPFKSLFDVYPDSKYILTTRNKTNWVKSINKQYHKNFNKRQPKHRQIIEDFYGTQIFSDKVWVNRKQAYETEVIKFFDGNPNFITMDICFNDNNWDVLCEFLGTDKPNCEFPHKNKTKD